MRILKSTNLFNTILILGIIGFVYLNATTYLLTDVFKVDLNTDFEFSSISEEFFTAIILAPLFETLIFQHGLIQLINLIAKSINIKSSITYYTAVFISGLLFGISHYYSVYYVMLTIVVGCYFAIIYLYFLKTTSSSIKAFKYVCYVHALSNLLTFIYRYLF